MHFLTPQKTNNFLVPFHCLYDNNYQEIYEPVYEQNIIFYDEENFDFEGFVRDNSSEFYEA